MGKKFFLSLLFFAALLLTAAGTARAQSVSTPNFDPAHCQGHYDQPRHLLVTCQPGWVSQSDQIDIYFGVDVNPQTAWQDTALTQPSTWIFRPHGGLAALIIVFSRAADGTLTARIFDDQNGDYHVSYHLTSGGGVTIDEGGSAVVTVVAKDGWWQHGAMVNYNLDIRVDGAVRAAHGAGFQGYLSSLHNDGQTDFRIRVWDSNHNGHPEFQLTQLLAPLPGSSGYYRSEMIGDQADAEAPFAAGVIWPYLAAQPWGYNKPYHQSYPPIQVDWANAKVVAVGEFVASRGNEHNWFSYSLLPVKDGTLNQLDFEQPMAFYDLADNQDGLPELMVRFVHFAATDSFSPWHLRSQNTALDEIRYSWSSSPRSDARWDYAIGTAGTQAITTTVALPVLSAQMVPYAQIPAWVWQQNWAYATFIAAEQPSYISTEGLYEWPTTEGVPNYATSSASPLAGSVQAQLDYLSGSSDQPPAGYYTAMPVGMRGEYATLGGKVGIYLSAIDHRLHLLNASKGVWNVDGHTQVIYANQGGPYLDQWSEQQDGNTTRSLRWAAGYYVYTDTGKLVIAEAPPIPAVLVTTPPANHQEWAALGQELRAVQTPPLTTFPIIGNGRQVTLWGATMDSYHLRTGGFSVILHVKQAGGRADGEFSWANGLAVGDYLLGYDAKTGFSIRKATPAHLNAMVSIPPGTAHLLQPLGLRLEVSNSGDSDATANLALSYAVSGAATALTTTSVTVAGGGRMQLPLTWLPQVAGDTAIRLELNGVTAFSSDLAVADAPHPDAALLNVGLPDWLFGLLIILIISIAGTGATLVFTAWRLPGATLTTRLQPSMLRRQRRPATPSSDQSDAVNQMRGGV